MAGPLTDRDTTPIPGRVIVSVAGGDEAEPHRATIIESTQAAQRLIEALIAAGCEAKDIDAFCGHEVKVEVALTPTVSLVDQDGSTLAAHLPPLPAPPVAGPRESVAAPALFQLEPAPPLGNTPAIERDYIEGAPAPRYRLRMDRLIWACLWTASIVVLIASLLASTSRSEPREFVPGAPSSRALAPTPEADTLNSSVAPAPALDSHLPQCAQNSPNACHCSDFTTQAEAQAFYSRFPPGRGNIVDTNGDGVFCKWLPAATPRR